MLDQAMTTRILVVEDEPDIASVLVDYLKRESYLVEHIANGQQATFRELCAKIVKLDDDTRCEPVADRKDVYTQALTRQGDLTRRLHAAGYL